MDIQITIKAKDETILKEAMGCIDQAAKGKPQWKKDGISGTYETECHATEEDLLPVLRGLVAKYPELDIFAVYSQDIREDDTSAQWWSVTKIKTEHHADGTATLRIDSSVHWF